jgi:hypothetical protein
MEKTENKSLIGAARAEELSDMELEKVSGGVSASALSSLFLLAARMTDTVATEAEKAEHKNK